MATPSDVQDPVFNVEAEEYELIKCVPGKWMKRKNDIYMGRKTNFLAQKKRCLKLLESGYTEVFLHGLGASVDRTVNLALELKLELDPLLEVSAKTGTLTMTDELRKVNGDASSEFGSRYCSVIHIRVFKNSCFVNSVDSKDLSDVAVTLRKK